MNSTERTKEFCKEHKIPIAKLERELGFSNGYIGQLKKDLPADRLMKIANYLNVTPEFLMSGEMTDISDTHYYIDKETEEIAQEISQNPDMKSLFDLSRKMPPDRLKAHLEFMKKLQDEDGNA